MIFKIFVLSLLVLISCGNAADNRELTNTIRHKHPTIAYGMPYPEDEPCEITADIIGEIKTEINEFLEHLGKGSFSFKDTINESDGIKAIREAITDCIAQDPLYVMKQLKRIWSASLNQDILVSMINIARNARLYDEGQELYMLSAVMLAYSEQPGIPQCAVHDLFSQEQAPKIISHVISIKRKIDLSQCLHTPLDVKKILEMWLGLSYFENYPLLTRKLYLLIPENKILKDKLAVMIDEQRLNIDVEGSTFTTQNQRDREINRLVGSKRPSDLKLRLADRIMTGESTCDEDGTPIASSGRDETAAGLYRDIINLKIRSDYENVMVSHAKNKLAELLSQKRIDKNEKGHCLKNDSKRSEAIERLCIESGTPHAVHLLATMLITKNTNKDNNGRILIAPQEKIDAIKRMMINHGDGSYEFNIACAYHYLFADTDIDSKRECLKALEESLSKGYTIATYNYIYLKSILKKSESSSVTPPEEDSDETEDDDDFDIHLDTHPDVESSTLMSSEDISAFRQQQIEKTAAWRKTVELRKVAWREKTSRFSHQTASTQKQITTTEHWDKLAVNGRLKLAELWDQRIINLVDAIKAGDTRLGAPEMLTEGEYDGWMSRRISRKHRLIYNFVNGMLVVRECGQHYRGR